jgi:hypothetical protein
MMATCKDCLHEKVCVWNAELEQACNEDCSDFKNKSDYAEVKHGEWIDKEYFGIEFPECSVCEWCDENNAEYYAYCPNCGAKMDGGKGDE